MLKTFLSLLFFLFAVTSSSDGEGSLRKLKHYRLTANQIRERNLKLNLNKHPKDQRLFSTSLPFDGIIDGPSVGTPRRTITMRLETGVNSISLVDRSYKNIDPNFKDQVYDPKLSSTSVKTSDFYFGLSGAYKFSGVQYADMTELFDPINQTFGTIQKAQGGFGDDPILYFDGIFGIAWDPMEVAKDNVTPFSSPIMNILANRNGRVVSIWQGSHKTANGSIALDAIINYGAINYAACANDVKLWPIGAYGNSLLSFTVDKFQFGDYEKNFWSDNHAKLDTGFSVIYVPKAAYQAIYNSIKPDYNSALHLYTTNCSRASTLTDWIFTINGNDFNLPATQYIVDIEIGNGRCVVAFETSEGARFVSTEFVFGNPMLRQYCSIYDVKNNKVGLATALQVTQ